MFGNGQTDRHTDTRDSYSNLLQLSCVSVCQLPNHRVQLHYAYLVMSHGINHTEAQTTTALFIVDAPVIAP